MTDEQVRTLRAKMLGAMMRELRLESGKSLKETAELIGTSSSTLSSYEQGRKSISLPELELLAYHLDTPLRVFTQPSEFQQEEGPDFDPAIMVSLRQRMIAAMLKKRRLDQGITQKDLAEAVDMPSSRISAYERGLRPIPVPDLESILKVLDQPIGEYVDTQGPVGEWNANQAAFERFLELPEELREFFLIPAGEAYLQVAVSLSKFDLQDVRAVAEAILEITE